MTLLTSTSDIIRVVTGSAVANIEVQANYMDLVANAPGSSETEITTATTTTVVAAPGASEGRRLKGMTIRNTHASSSSQVTVQKYNGTIAADLMGVTLRPQETLVRTEFADWMHLTAAGARYAYSRPQNGILGISGAKAEVIPRMLCQETSNTITSGTMNLQPIWLAAGTVVSSISWFSSTTAAGTPTNQLFGLYNSRYCLLGVTTNDTTTAWAANTIKTLSLTTAYTVTVSGWYYVAIMVAATTPPSIKSNSNGSALGALPPFTSGNSSTGLTTTLPNPCAAITSIGTNRYWACVS